jgi:hypothetical protein
MTRKLRIVSIVALLCVVLSTAGCNGNVYVGVSSGAWAGYPYGGYGYGYPVGVGVGVGFPL